MLEVLSRQLLKKNIESSCDVSENYLSFIYAKAE